MTSQLDELFPAPSNSVGKLIPHILGGATSGTVRAVTDSLKDDYEKNHAFCHHKGFHKLVSTFSLVQQANLFSHTVHHLLALYALGADEKTIRSTYTFQTNKQRKAITAPRAITSENLADHLGDEK